MPAARSPAQIEVSRRNGARSKGPVTEAGKACASRNALKQGLAAMEHLVLEDEVPDALEALINTVAEEVGAETEIESRLARRLAIAFWKSERANKIETALFASMRHRRSARRMAATNGRRQIRSPPSTSAASTPSAAIMPSRAARSAAA